MVYPRVGSTRGCEYSESARAVGADSLLLCDSGGQYECGTTDVTRTHHTGTPTAFQKDAYTRVLQGHIALASARFPEDTSGFVLDAFARSHLWAEGLDYRHGTGHGVGRRVTSRWRRSRGGARAILHDIAQAALRRRAARSADCARGG